MALKNLTKDQETALKKGAIKYAYKTNKCKDLNPVKKWIKNYAKSMFDRELGDDDVNNIINEVMKLC